MSAAHHETIIFGQPCYTCAVIRNTCYCFILETVEIRMAAHKGVELSIKTKGRGVLEFSPYRYCSVRVPFFLLIPFFQERFCEQDPCILF